jgi:hypothetical protein
MDKAEKNYTVISYSVGGRNNKVYKSGDKVKESNFPPGNAEDLVKGGFLKEFTKKEQAKADKVAQAAQDAAEQAKKDDATKALKDAENAVEEANMAVDIELEKVDGLKGQLASDNDGDVDKAVIQTLEGELVDAEGALKSAQEVAELAMADLEALKGS